MEPNEFPKFFRLTPSERKATKVLLGLIILTISAYHIIQHYYQPVIQLTDTQKYFLQEKLKDVKKQAQIKRSELKLIPFNPNTVSYNQLIGMGIEPYPAKSLINYRNKGAQYKHKAELKKVYGIDSTLYETIKPYIEIPHTTATIAKDPIELKEAIIKNRIRDFNPNKTSSKNLIAMGISPYFSRNLEKYIANGGIIKQVEDLNKIYGMSDSLYQIIAPFVSIQIDSSEEISSKPNSHKSIPVLSINLNTADTSELKKLKGIGSKRAELIIKYRTNLGGFYSTHQIKEVWSIDQEVFDPISDLIYINNDFKRIDVSETEFSDLLRHKYFDYNMTKMIKNYFEKRDQSTHLDQFIQSSPIDSIKLSRALPYLRLIPED